MSETDKKMELAELARRAADGERDAINAMMKRYTGELYFYTRMYNGDRETARGCVQAAIRTILGRIRECSEAPDPEKWMRSIVSKEALALNLPVHAENLEEKYSSQDEKKDPYADVPYDDEDVRVGILHVMDTLNPSQRSAAALRYYEHKTPEEIAGLTDLSLRETKALLAETKKKIKAEMPIGTFLAYTNKLNPDPACVEEATTQEIPVVQEEPVITENKEVVMTEHRKRKLNIPRLILVIVIALLLILGLFKVISGFFGGGKAKPTASPDETAEVMPSEGEGEPGETPSGEVTPTPETTPAPTPTPATTPTPTSETTPATTPTPTPAVTATPTPGGQSSETGSLVVNIDNLNIRSGAGTNYPALRKAVKGKTYRVYEVKKSGGYTWYRIGTNEWLADNGKWVTYRAERQ